MRVLILIIQNCKYSFFRSKYLITHNCTLGDQLLTLHTHNLTMSKIPHFENPDNNNNNNNSNNIEIS